MYQYLSRRYPMLKSRHDKHKLKLPLRHTPQSKYIQLLLPTLRTSRFTLPRHIPPLSMRPRFLSLRCRVPGIILELFGYQ